MVSDDFATGDRLSSTRLRVGSGMSGSTLPTTMPLDCLGETHNVIDQGSARDGCCHGCRRVAKRCEP